MFIASLIATAGCRKRNPLTGEWTVESIRRGDENINVDGERWYFGENGLAKVIADGRVGSVRYLFDPSHSPNWLDQPDTNTMLAQPWTRPGIVEFVTPTTIRWKFAADVLAKRATGFAPEKNQVVYIMRRTSATPQ